MGILDRLGLTRGARLASSSRRLGISSPYAEPGDPLPPIVITDLLTDEQRAKLPLSRDEAMTVPAVSKARNLLVASISSLPLVAMKPEPRDGDGRLVSRPIENQPTWLYRTDGTVTLHERMAWTVDDLIFYGCSLWAVTRGTRDGEGRRPILDAEWVPQSDWSINDETGALEILDRPVKAEDVILFNHPFEGLLKLGRRTIRGAVGMETAWTERALSPVPIIELKVLDDQLTQDEIDGYVKAWSEARRKPGGAVGATPPSIEIKVHGEVPVDLFEAGRNAIRTDIGSFTNVRASMLDGTTGIDSLTYTTKDGERNAFYDIDLPFWTDYIEARLSMDDVVPRGTSIAFDKGTQQTTPPPTGTPRED